MYDLGSHATKYHTLLDILPNKTAINTINFMSHDEAEFNGLMMRSNIKHAWNPNIPPLWDK